MAGQGPYNPNGGMPPSGMPPGQMPPGMMPGMGPPPQQQMMAPRPVRRGTSKAVPVVVSAGLAVGVFCGLLFGVGVDKGEAAPPSTSHPMKKAEETRDIPPALQPTVNEGPKKEPAKAGGGSAVAAAGSGSAAGSAAGSGSAVAAATKPKLVIELAPDTVVSGAKILVDGKEITGTSLEYDIDPATNKPKTATVVVTVKAQGYKDAEQKVSLDGDTTVKFEMVKGKSTLPKDTAVAGAGSGSAAPAATTPPAGTQAVAKTTPPAGNGSAAKTTPPAGNGSAVKTTPPVTPPVHHHTNPGNGSAKKGSGGLIDI